jgi:hypothetical protein
MLGVLVDGGGGGGRISFEQLFSVFHAMLGSMSNNTASIIVSASTYHEQYYHLRHNNHHQYHHHTPDSPHLHFPHRPSAQHQSTTIIRITISEVDVFFTHTVATIIDNLCYR